MCKLSYGLIILRKIQLYERSILAICQVTSYWLVPL